jgi:hypothetical protein
MYFHPCLYACYRSQDCNCVSPIIVVSRYMYETRFNHANRQYLPIIGGFKNSIGNRLSCDRVVEFSCRFLTIYTKPISTGLPALGQGCKRSIDSHFLFSCQLQETDNTHEKTLIDFFCTFAISFLFFLKKKRHPALKIWMGLISK